MTLTRQARKRPTSGTSTERDDNPLPYDVAASETGRDYRNLLKDWVSLIAEGLSAERIRTPLPTPATAPTLASYILTHLTWLARQEVAPDAYREILAAVNGIRRTIDLAPGTTIIGPCGGVVEGVVCTETLRAYDDAAVTICRTCGTRWDVAEKRVANLTHTTGAQLPAHQLTVAFRVGAMPLGTDRIKSWVRRGHLTPTGTNTKGRALYSVAHVARLIHHYETGRKLTNITTEQDTA